MTAGNRSTGSPNGAMHDGVQAATGITAATGAFGCWRAGGDDTVGRYAAGYAAAVTRRVVALGCAAFADGADADLRALLARSGAACWNPGFGLANGFAKQGPAAREQAAGQLFIALALLGFEGRHEGRYHFPVRHRLAGQWFAGTGAVAMTAASGRITVASDDQTVSIAVHDPGHGEEAAAGLFGEGWVKWGYAVDPFILEPADTPLSSQAVPHALEQLRAASGLLGIDGRVSAWCARLLCELSLTGCGNHARLTSRSNPFQPGNVQLSVPGPALHLSELLVHEASHQHYFLAAMAGPTIAPEHRGDTAFSALRGCQRPIDRILLGLHAIWNILEYLALHARSGGAASGDAVVRIDELASTAQSLALPFAREPRLLSPKGRDLMGDGLDRINAIVAEFAPSQQAATAHGMAA